MGGAGRAVGRRGLVGATSCSANSGDILVKKAKGLGNSQQGGTKAKYIGTVVMLNSTWPDFADAENKFYWGVFCRNKLRSRPTMMSPPPNAFVTPAVVVPSGMPAEVGLLNRQRNQENFSAPHPTPAEAGSSPVLLGKQQTLARRRVSPSQQGTQFREGPAARSGSSLSSSSSSTSGSSSSSPVPRTSGVPVRRAAAEQGMAGTAPRAAAPRAAALKLRTTRDSEVCLPFLLLQVVSLPIRLRLMHCSVRFSCYAVFGRQPFNMPYCVRHYTPHH